MASYFEEQDKDISKILERNIVDQDGITLTKQMLESMLADAWQHGWTTGFGWQDEIDREWVKNKPTE